MNFEQMILLAVDIHANELWCVQKMCHVGDGQYEIIAYIRTRQKHQWTIDSREGWNIARAQEEELARLTFPASTGRKQRRKLPIG